MRHVLGAVLGEKVQKVGWVVGLCGCEDAGLGAVGRQPASAFHRDQGGGAIRIVA
jgi:hypothetical protein